MRRKSIRINSWRPTPSPRESYKSSSQQRDTLNTQLQDANQSYQKVRTELASLRDERERVLIRSTSLEARIEELMAINRDQERRLKDSDSISLPTGTFAN